MENKRYPQDIYPVPNFSQYQQQQQQQEQQQQLESIALEKTQSTQSSASTDSTNSMFYSSTDEDMQRSDPLTINPRSSLSSRRPASTEYFPIVLGHEIRIESPNLIACECGGKFTGEKPKNVRSNYKRHCKSRRKEARIVCQVCSKVSNRLDNHRQHLKTH